MAPAQSKIELQVEDWLEGVLKELPSAKRSDAEQTPNTHWAKLQLEYEVPMVAEAAQHTAPISGPYHVHHLHLSIDITAVVRFEEQNGQTICILPHKAFPVDVKPDQPKEQQIELSTEQTTEISGTYRGYILSCLQLIKRFPDLTDLDISITGNIPNRSSAILNALGVNSMGLYMYVIGNSPGKLKKITVLCGHTMDKYSLEAQSGRAKTKKYEWELKEMYRVKKGQDVDEMDLGDVKELLRSERAVRSWPYHEPAGAMLPRQALPQVVVTGPTPNVTEGAATPGAGESMEIDAPMADEGNGTSPQAGTIPTSHLPAFGADNDQAELLIASPRARKGKGRANEASEMDLDYRQDSVAMQTPVQAPSPSPARTEELDDLFNE